jgi:hypothetical protein
VGLKTKYGDRHAVTNNFILSPGGAGIPDGKGGFIQAEIHLISLDEFSKDVGTFKTADGREHSNGHIEAFDVGARCYANDDVQMAALQLWLAAVENGLPGAKLPSNVEVMHADGTPGETWEVEEVMLKRMGHIALDREAGQASEVPLTFSFYNPSRMPV